MSGWVAHEGFRPYEGVLARGIQTVVANPLSPAAALINREAEADPPLLRISRNLWWEE